MRPMVPWAAGFTGQIELWEEGKKEEELEQAAASILTIFAMRVHRGGNAPQPQVAARSAQALDHKVRRGGARAAVRWWERGAGDARAGCLERPILNMSIYTRSDTG